VIIILFCITGFAQEKTSIDKFEEAEDLIEYNNIHKALAIYMDLLNESPNNANLNFKVGFCYLNTATEKVKAIPYLEFAAKYISSDYKVASFEEIQAPVETLFYLGKAYHVNYRFDEAESSFIELKDYLTEDDVELKERIDHELSACQVARQLINDPVEMNVSNLGKNINSIYSEHSPVISGDESILIFTSKRKENTGGNIMDDGQYFEDIYISSFDGSQYRKAQKISENINTAGHEASIGLSFDGSKLFIYKDDGTDGNIYVSNRKGAEWMAPEKLPEPINSKYRETHASMSFDQNEIFFTSDRKGGFGGLDIYRVRKLPNGNWSKAQNLGSKINTKYDEEGPYLHPDGTSLFFSSAGHGTMGGLDIFVSSVDKDGIWSSPKNIGYPINTPDDDVYYIPSVDGRRAYYASYANNSIGDYDIFRIDLAESHVRNQTVIAGYAMTSDGVFLEDAIITLFDYDDEVIGIYTPDPETKKFLFILPRGKTYSALFESSNVEEYEYTVNVPTDSYDQTRQVIAFSQIIVPVEKDPDIELEPLADNIFADEDLEVTEDTLMLDTKTIESKSVASKTKTQAELETADLLVASELYENDEYIEPTVRKTNANEEPEKDTLNIDLKINDNLELPNANEATSKKVIFEKNSKAKKRSIFLGILLGLALIGSTIYMVFKRRRNN